MVTGVNVLSTSKQESKNRITGIVPLKTMLKLKAKIKDDVVICNDNVMLK